MVIELYTLPCFHPLANIVWFFEFEPKWNKKIKNTYRFTYLNLENLMFMYSTYIASIVQKQNKDEQGRSCGS
jgi:hypothetical protein